MLKKVCPACNRRARVEVPKELSALLVTCLNCGEYLLAEDVYEGTISKNAKNREKLSDFLTSCCKEMNAKNKIPGFYIKAGDDFRYLTKKVVPLNIASIL